MAQWTIGTITVSHVGEQIGFATLPPERFFVGFDRSLLIRHLDELLPHHYAPASDQLITSVHSWLIRGKDLTILVDSCGGNHKHRPGFPRFHQLQTPYLQRLEAAGARAEEIDIVLCTHLHADHVGWNTMLQSGQWVPTFPNARYLFARTEVQWGDPRHNKIADADPLRGGAYRDSVLPIIEHGQATLVDGLYSIDDSLQIEPAPGHTCGHVVLKLADRNGKALFCGDALHHPLQAFAPSWNSAYCELPEQARVTRRKLLEYCAEHGALLFPGHFGAPHVAAIDRAGDAFKLRFIDPDGN